MCKCKEVGVEIEERRQQLSCHYESNARLSHLSTLGAEAHDHFPQAIPTLPEQTYMCEKCDHDLSHARSADLAVKRVVPHDNRRLREFGVNFCEPPLNADGAYHESI